ncbi:hypothetical protein HH214_11240 [Mucilaginibacter robiniae]|uniref:Uncharacterized protein n=1 Tax=Mucilaginibacter robiniae TaxID=2728022 RepID=A0A7L5DZ75_9SPHI|nr:hypothetical protein [Mucilaginibacter robiniae]QJD96400.1 hypothetical protein HH214_11240 [Mucilaginibacter robiniae]
MILIAQPDEQEQTYLWAMAGGGDESYPGELDADEDDEAFDDYMDDEDDLREIRTSDDLEEPDPEDDDHLPDDDLQ